MTGSFISSSNYLRFSSTVIEIYLAMLIDHRDRRWIPTNFYDVLNIIWTLESINIDKELESIKLEGN